MTNQHISHGYYFEIALILIKKVLTTIITYCIDNI